MDFVYGWLCMATVWIWILAPKVKGRARGWIVLYSRVAEVIVSEAATYYNQHSRSYSNITVT